MIRFLVVAWYFKLTIFNFQFSAAGLDPDAMRENAAMLTALYPADTEALLTGIILSIERQKQNSNSTSSASKTATPGKLFHNC